MKMKNTLCFVLLSIFIIASCAAELKKDERASRSMGDGAVKVRNKRAWFGRIRIPGVDRIIEAVKDAVEDTVRLGKEILHGFTEVAKDAIEKSIRLFKEAAERFHIEDTVEEAANFIDEILNIFSKMTTQECFTSIKEIAEEVKEYFIKPDLKLPRIAKLIKDLLEISEKCEDKRMQPAQYQVQTDEGLNEICLQICVTPWSNWSNCTHVCGGGTKTRIRSRYGSVCDGRPCPYELSETSECIINCANGGSPSTTGHCNCQKGYSGMCCNDDIVCPNLQAPVNGKKVCEGNKYQNQCHFMCNQGYTLDKGSSKRTCQDSGKWTGTDAQCNKTVCPILQVPANGNLTCEGNKYTNKCYFSCDQGYILEKGSSQRTCQDSGIWNGIEAQCTACPMNTYKSEERICLPCPTHSHTMNIASVKNQCLCDNGYEGPPGGTCSDANECLENGGKGKCNDVCRNTDGSYVCECSTPGYIIDVDVDRHVCKLNRTCRNLTETDAPRNGGFVCHTFDEENSKQCSVRCNAGYELLYETNDYESCGATTGYKWTHEIGNRKIPSCIKQYFPDVQIDGISSYFVGNCTDLTPEELQNVTVDFAKMLESEGICMDRQSKKVCNAEKFRIICGTTRRRKRRGLSETVDDVNISFELAAKVLQPSDCDQICPMLSIQANDCEQLCVPSYRRYLLALMKHTKRSIENLFNNPDLEKVNFQSGRQPLRYQSGSLKTSEVIFNCPAGMKNDEKCVPCSPGTYYSETDNECLICPEHTFQAHPQQTSCNDCPIGTYAPSNGSTSCLSCPHNRWGERCSGICFCEYGECNSTNGQCDCRSGWEGPLCDIDIQSCTSQSCYPGVTCHDVPAPGTGFKCDPCPFGFHGDGTFCEAI